MVLRRREQNCIKFTIDSLSEFFLPFCLEEMSWTEKKEIRDLRSKREGGERMGGDEEAKIQSSSSLSLSHFLDFPQNPLFLSSLFHLLPLKFIARRLCPSADLGDHKSHILILTDFPSWLLDTFTSSARGHNLREWILSEHLDSVRMNKIILCNPPILSCIRNSLGTQVTEVTRLQELYRSLV